MIELNRRLEEEKKRDYTMARLEDLKSKRQKIEYDGQLKQKDVEESKQLMNNYTIKELQREQQYRDKYSNINANMERKLNNYNENVLKLNIKRQMSQQLREDISAKEYKQKLDNDYMRQIAQRNAQLMETNAVIHQQLQDKKHNGNLNDQLYNYEGQKMKEREMEIKSVDDYLREERRK